jgi:hypothetical protein
MYGNRLGPHLDGRMLYIFDYRRGFKSLSNGHASRRQTRS